MLASVAAATLIGSGAIVFIESAAHAATSYGDYAVIALNDVQIGVGSTVNGNVGAEHNGHSHDALNMNGGTTINGDAHVGEDVSMANNTTISGTLFRVGNLSKNASASIGSDQHVADADLPSGPIPSQWPTGAPNGPPATYCAVNHTPDINNANGTTIDLSPGNWGTISAGSSTTLNFTAPGDYFLDGLSTGSVSISYPAGVRLFVCSKVELGNITSGTPAHSIYTEVAAMPVAADGHGFEVTNGPWVGDVVVPTAGIHYGSGSSGSASVLGHLWASFIDIEHGVVITGPTPTTTTTSSSTSTSTSTSTTSTSTSTSTLDLDLVLDDIHVDVHIYFHDVHVDVDDLDDCADHHDIVVDHDDEHRRRNHDNVDIDVHDFDIDDVVVDIDFYDGADHHDIVVDHIHEHRRRDNDIAVVDHVDEHRRRDHHVDDSSGARQHDDDHAGDPRKYDDGRVPADRDAASHRNRTPGPLGRRHPDRRRRCARRIAPAAPHVVAVTA